MSVATGYDFTVLVTEQGGLWAFGNGGGGALGLGMLDSHAQYVPASVDVGDELFDAEIVVMVAAAARHTACVTKTGSLWSWGNSHFGQLGHGDIVQRQRPKRVDRKMFGDASAIMVACGISHTLVLTAARCVWSSGHGLSGKLGHANVDDTLVFVRIQGELFNRVEICMVAAGEHHSVAIETHGKVWTWGRNNHGQLGHSDNANRLVPTLLDHGDIFDGATAILVASAGSNTAIVTLQGSLWMCGQGEHGRLGSGNDANSSVFVRVGSDAIFQESPVLMASCGHAHTMAVMKNGTLWSFGQGNFGQLGHNDRLNRMVPTQIHANHQFGDDANKFVSAVSGYTHSAAVTEMGVLYTWGQQYALGHVLLRDRLIPTRVDVQLLHDERVGRCHDIAPTHAIAFAMGTHIRLGNMHGRLKDSRRSLRIQGISPYEIEDRCKYSMIPAEIVRCVVEAGVSWPEGPAGEIEGMVRLMGGGMMKIRI